MLMLDEAGMAVATTSELLSVSRMRSVPAELMRKLSGAPPDLTSVPRVAGSVELPWAAATPPPAPEPPPEDLQPVAKRAVTRSAAATAAAARRARRIFVRGNVAGKAIAIAPV